ncbi:glycosyltransferase [Candidatus Altiarchaeota archaeon]
MDKEEIYLSVVIPVYNEEENILALYEELKSVLEKTGKNFEIIFVDDGSTDSSYNEIQDIHKRDPVVKAVRFRRNFGQTAALNAGFKSAAGKLVVVLDADLQNNIEVVVGYQVV